MTRHARPVPARGRAPLLPLAGGDEVQAAARRLTDTHEIVVGPAEELDRRGGNRPEDRVLRAAPPRLDDRGVAKLDDARCGGARLVHDGDVGRRQVAAVGGGSEEPAERVRAAMRV